MAAPVRFIILVLIISVTVFYYLNSPSNEVPMYENTWWGPNIKSNEADKSIKSFKIHWSEKGIEDLRNRLNKTRRLPSPLEDAAWTYGMNGTFLEEKVLSYWLNGYNFKSRLAYLNRYPQFTTNVQGLTIHYLHVKPVVKNDKRVVPILLLHGWPGSVVEFYKIINYLTTPRDDVDFGFEIIIPSLPGYGFSDAAVRPGLGCPQVAVVMKNFMLRLGFDEFYIHGGDLGAVIAAQLSTLFPNHILGLHSTMCTVASPKIYLKTMFYSFFPSLLLSDEDYHLMYPLKERFSRTLLLTGYLHLQATKPDTFGVGLSDSPAGLAAHILEKFSDATKRDNFYKEDGGLFEKFTPDELIDNLMMYWIPNKMTTAMRLYAESFNSRVNVWREQWPVKIPSACAQFPYEIIWYPEEFLRERYLNLLQVTRMPRGGHFSALEEPELLANDIWAFVSLLERRSPEKMDL